jgi:hypothetical protein
MDMPPNAKPTATGNHEGMLFCSVARSSAGKSSEKKLAANITPAANPSMPSRTFLFTSFVKNTDAAPIAVRSHVNTVAKKAWRIGLSSANEGKFKVKHLIQMNTRLICL